MRSERISGELGLNQATLAFVALLTIVPGCRARAGGVGPEECKPTSGTLPADATADGIAGEYRLTLVADQGPHQGRAVSGQLWLEPYEGQLRQRTRLGGATDSTVVYAAFGTTDVDLSAVGAVKVGSTTSMDPMQPGVLVIEHHPASEQAASSEVMIRLGSEANRRDRQRFDGGYTALRVREATPERLAGTWSSGVTRERAAGYFCATRRD